MAIELTRSIHIHDRRCWKCGRWWGCEQSSDFEVRCPYCAGAELDSARQEVTRLHTVVSRLRGVITRMKRARTVRR